MDVTALRADIKSWERAFKTENQRAPTLDDLKVLPKIAAKYKLYKKLCKEAVVQPAQKKTNGIAPSTPPRNSSSLPGPSSLVPKSRPITQPTTNETPNPFSPTKSSHRITISFDDKLPFPQPNFTSDLSTPSSKRSYSAPSPDPFPSVMATLEPASPLVNSAVKKARKRLRGDLVSPTPKKPRMVRAPASSGSEKDLDEGEIDVPYVVESPVKASTNGKNFKPLFEEGRLSQPVFVKKGPFSKSVRDLFDHETNFESPRTRSAAQVAILQNQTRKLPGVKKSKKKQMNPAPGTNRPYSATISDFQENSLTVDAPETPDTPSPLLNRKRWSSIDADELSFSNQFPSVVGALLPPSPPPNPAQPKSEMYGRGMVKDRKKPKLASSSRLTEITTDDEPDLEVVELASQPDGSRRVSADDAEDETAREAFGFTTRDISNSVLEAEDISDSNEPEINLPEDLRNVLHISVSNGSAREERALVESLLQGRPCLLGQWGEVWGVGESEDVTAATTDDEWAGEGVAWEVGEL
ncbi:hypothetical protein ACEPAF_3845 [Sanghuangporus sanghuang]